MIRSLILSLLLAGTATAGTRTNVVVVLKPCGTLVVVVVQPKIVHKVTKVYRQPAPPPVAPAPRPVVTAPRPNIDYYAPSKWTPPPAGR